jgi:hypothetical protein
LEDEAGKRTRQVFLVMAGIGLDVQMAQETSALAKRHLGWLAYVSPIAQSIIRNRLFSVQYRVDGGRSRSARAHTIIVGNCGTLTGSMLLLPAAKVDDGVLDVVMLRPKGRFGGRGSAPAWRCRVSPTAPGVAGPCWCWPRTCRHWLMPKEGPPRFASRCPTPCSPMGTASARSAPPGSPSARPRYGSAPEPLAADLFLTRGQPRCLARCRASARPPRFPALVG